MLAFQLLMNEASVWITTSNRWSKVVTCEIHVVVVVVVVVVVIVLIGLFLF